MDMGQSRSICIFLYLRGFRLGFGVRRIVILTMQDDCPSRGHLRMLVNIEVIELEVQPSIHARDRDGLPVWKMKNVRCHDWIRDTV